MSRRAICARPITRDVIDLTHILNPRFLDYFRHPVTWRAMHVRPYIEKRFANVFTLAMIKSLDLMGQARGGIENKHSTHVESPPHPPCVCESVHPDGTRKVLLRCRFECLFSMTLLPGRRAAGRGGGVAGPRVGRCRLTVSKPELKACLVSALETKM
jgi:hypothetical protein